jgi:hypothetical protein
MLAAQAKRPANAYAPFFAGRDGWDLPTKLSDAVVSPQAGASSASFDEVARNARASMDARYAQMAESGTPFDINSFEGKDWYTLTADLDRRSLFAVASNAGGMFSEEEQDIAQSIMGQQQGLAMGLYSGPTSKADQFQSAFPGDYAAIYQAGMRFLDQVSPEEKASVTWAVERANLQVAYKWTTGSEPERPDGGTTLLDVMVRAMKTMDQPGRGTTTGRLDTADDLLRQPWMEGFEDQLYAALAAQDER